MTPELVHLVADWWTCHLIANGHTQQADAFLAALKDALTKGQPWNDTIFVRLAVDYDPCEILLAALHAAGIECRGFMCSARDLFPMKTRMTVYMSGRVVVNIGRGGQDVVLAPGADPHATA